MRRRGPLLTFAASILAALVLASGLSVLLPSPAEARVADALALLLMGVLPLILLRPALTESARPLGEWLGSVLLVSATLLLPVLLGGAWLRRALEPSAWPATLAILAMGAVLAAVLVPAWRDARRDERPRLLALALLALVLLLPPWGEGLRPFLLIGAPLAGFLVLLTYRGDERARDAPLYAFFAGVGATLLLALGGLLLGRRDADLARIFFALMPPVAALLALVLPAWLAERA